MGELSRTKKAGTTAFLILIWGLCWPVFKIALAYTPPILFAGMICGLGCIL